MLFNQNQSQNRSKKGRNKPPLLLPMAAAMAIFAAEMEKDFSEQHYSNLNRAYQNTSAVQMFKSDSVFNDKNKNLKDFYKLISEDIYEYCKYLGVEPHWQQKELLDAYQEGKRRITVRSGQGPGKTFSSTIILTHWLLKNPMGLLVVTAPTMDQCKKVWLGQARQLIEKADPRIQALFTFTNTTISVLGHKAEDWGCYLATANRSENFQGKHRERMAIHCEESSGIPREIMEAIAGTLTNDPEHSMWTHIGNPNNRDTYFYDTFFGPGSDDWKKLHWNGEETPTTKYFNPDRNAKVAKEFGKDSDVYRIRVLGEFPKLDPTAIVSLEDCYACTKPTAKLNAYKENNKAKIDGRYRKQFGIDLARFGGDENALCPWDHHILREPEFMANVDPWVAINRAIFLQADFGWEDEECMYSVDTSGIGEGVVGKLGSKRSGYGKTVHEFYTQARAHDSKTYANAMSEAIFKLCQAIRDKKVYMPEDKRMFEQLAKRKYEIDKDGRIKVETKDQYKARMKGGDTGSVGKSPDRAESAAIGFYPYATKSARISTF